MIRLPCFWTKILVLLFKLLTVRGAVMKFVAEGLNCCRHANPPSTPPYCIKWHEILASHTTGYSCSWFICHVPSCGNEGHTSLLYLSLDRVVLDLFFFQRFWRNVTWHVASFNRN